MNLEGNRWNVILIQNTFVPHLSSQIINTPIFEEEQDMLVWTPSMTRAFSVWFAYRLILRSKGLMPSTVNSGKNTWQLIWRAQLHARHKILLWQILSKAMPMLDRLKDFTSIPTPNCYLCGSGMETLQHLILECPITTLLWWNSPWTIRLSAFNNNGVAEWLQSMFNYDDRSLFTEIKHEKICITGEGVVGM